MEISSRPYVDTDAAALTELFNTVDAAVGMEATFSEADTRCFMNGLIHDHATDTRMLFAADGRLVANASVPPVPAGGTQSHLFGAVHPEFQGQGLGRELLAWQLDRVAELRRELSADDTWMVTAVCDTRDIASIHLYIRYGLTPVRYYSGMYLDLDAATLDQAPPVPDTLRTVAYQPELLTALHAAHAEAFADHWGFARRERDEWAALVVESEAFRPELSLIAHDGPDIAAYVLVEEQHDPTRIYIRSVGTRRPWRGRGYATALLAQVLRNAAALGCASARLDVDAENPTGALGVYERLGFTAARTEVVYATHR